MSTTLQRILAAPGSRSRAGAEALERLRAAGLPARTHEDWRYANLPALDAVPAFASLPAVAPGGAETPALQPLPPPLPGYQRLVLVDGRCGDGLPAGLRAIEPTATTLDARGLARFAALAEGLVPAPLAFEVHGELDLELLCLVQAPDAAAASAIELRLAPGARLRLAERHLGDTAARGLACTSLRLQLGPGSSLQHQRLLDLAGAGLQLDTLEATIGEQASYLQRCMVAGGGTVRSSQLVSLAGRGAAFDWHGLAVATGREVRDLVLALRHEAPDTRSEQRFRGIADGRARVACSADAHVAASAPGTRLAQSLRGLLDGEAAEIDLKPRLTILTDAVQASHGATTGRLDDDLLFYMLARGLDAAEARALLKWAFLGEVFSGCEPAALRLAAEQAIAAHLRERPPADLLQ